MALITRLISSTQQHYFLFGPRGTGKSTWLRQQFSDAIWLDLLDSSIYRMYLARPERLIDLFEAHATEDRIIIDEIQRIPELLHIVHKLITERPGCQFILTGSSARKLKRAGVDLLAGRAIVRSMHPFIAAELGDDFSIDSALQYGMLPVVRASEAPGDSLKAYIHLYIEQEIKAEGLVRNLDQFVRFLEAITFSHGNVVNTSDIARECEVKRTTVVGYIEILEDLLLARKVPVFARRAKRALVSHTKFYLFDAGVFRALRPTGTVDRPEEISGQVLEGLVLQHLQALVDYGSMDAKIYFWRTRAGSEVDFIIYGDKVFNAIEVKNSIRIRPEDLTGLKSFRLDYPECKPILLYRGKEKIVADGILCIPVEAFLRSLIPGTVFAV